MQCGDKKTGYPIRNEDDPRDRVPNNDEYDSKRIVSAFPDKMLPHKELPFLRASSHVGAISSLQNLDLYPIQVHPEKMPGKKGTYENIAEVLYNYLIDYRFYEGLDDSHDTARAVEM